MNAFLFQNIAIDFNSLVFCLRVPPMRVLCWYSSGTFGNASNCLTTLSGSFEKRWRKVIFSSLVQTNRFIWRKSGAYASGLCVFFIERIPIIFSFANVRTLYHINTCEDVFFFADLPMCKNIRCSLFFLLPMFTVVNDSSTGCQCSLWCILLWWKIENELIQCKPLVERCRLLHLNLRNTPISIPFKKSKKFCKCFKEFYFRMFFIF